MGCEEDFFPELEKTDPQIVVDAWINNLPQKQTIRITETLPYYENKFTPGVENAIVFLMDNEGNRYDFNASGISGNYEWNPSVTEPVLGKTGNTYQLLIIIDQLEISSVSTLNRVPEIDSVVFRYEDGNSFIPQSYFASFFARDIVGRGDTYWIKAYKNNHYLSQPNEINIAFDAAIGIGSSADGINFIQPIRDGINPVETD